MALTEEQRAKLNAKAALKSSTVQHVDAKVVDADEIPYQGEIVSMMPVISNMPMKVCPSCGRQVDADSIVCSYCGYRFGTVQPNGMILYQNGYQQPVYPNQPVSYINIVNQQSPAQPKTSGLAVASLICSLVGLFILPWILSTLGIIFGGVGLAQCNNNPEMVKGKGCAIAGLVMGIAEILWSIYVILFVASAVRGFLGL